MHLDRRSALALLFSLISLNPAFAQTPPTTGTGPTPITFIVPWPEGGGTDVTARILKGQFEKSLGRPIVIQNLGGKGGATGSAVAAKAPADGSTVLFTLSSHASNPAVIKDLGFDTQKDFLPVGMVCMTPQVLVASVASPYRSLAEVIAAARKSPDGVVVGSLGAGSPSHLTGVLFDQRTGIRTRKQLFEGGGPAVKAVESGEVPLLWVSIGAAAEAIKSGRLRAIAVSTARPSAAFPDVPTVESSGVRDFVVDAWYGMFVPAGTPREAIDRLNKAMNDALADPAVADKLLAEGVVPVGGTPEALGTVVSDEIARWKKVCAEAGITPE